MWSILRGSILSLYVVPLILKTVEMTILQISDTHNRHQLLTDLPTADVLVHCEIGNVKFFGLGYNHQESLIPTDVDILITHEPPMMILDKSSGRHWGNLPLRNRVIEIRPQYHLFGHAHESYGIVQSGTTIFSNGSVMDNLYQLCHAPRLIEL